MSGPRQEILRLLAEGRITSREAEMLLDALDEGLTAGKSGSRQASVRSTRSVAPSPSGSRKAGVASRKKPAASSSGGKAVRPRAAARVSAKSPGPSSGRAARQKAATRRTACRSEAGVEEASSTALTPDVRMMNGSAAGTDTGLPSPPLEGARAAYTSPGSADDGGAGTGRAWDLPAGSTLRIGPPRTVLAAPAGLGLRGVDGNRLCVYRGAGADLRAAEAGAFELVWDKGILILDVPRDLGGLEILEIPGKVTLLHYAGPFAIEGLSGSLTVGPVKSPFRILRVGGDVDLNALALQGGLSTVAEVGGDVRVRATRDASFSVRASSLSGQVAFGRTIAVDSGDPGRRRGVWRLGSGAGQLNVTGVKGWIRLFQDPGLGETQ